MSVGVERETMYLSNTVHACLVSSVVCMWTEHTLYRVVGNIQYIQKAGQYWMSTKWCSIATTLKNALLMKASLSKLRSKWRVAMHVQWVVASYGGTL